MKKLLFLFFSSSFFISAQAQDVTINGIFEFKEPAKMVFLNYRNGDDRVNDSTEIKNGKFTFKQNLIEPTLGTIMVRFATKEGEARARVERMQIFLVPGSIQIKTNDSLKFAVVTGSKAHKEFEAYNKLLQPFAKKQETLGPRFETFRAAKDEAGMKSIQDEYQMILKENNDKVVKPYIDSHISSPIVLHIINQFIGSQIDIELAEPLYNNLSASNKNSYSGKSLKERIETAKKTAIGSYAMNFTQNDTLGKPVSLSDFKGKYVLIDFWASWCGPCREENPNLVRAFKQYKDKNFTVLGISLDQPGKHQLWLDAIHKDELHWTQVSDLKFWDNAVAKQYGIRSIPQNLLIDPSGKIIAKNIRGEKLHTTLEELIK